MERRQPPANAAPFLPPRRVMTEPAGYPQHQRSASSGSAAAPSADLVETLYNHPSAKLIAFTSSQRSPLIANSSSSDPQPGTLPASSPLERTIAVGPFRIYRAPGSVAFLSCGSALQPILPKSQCWCIDEDNSKFVLQIRRPNYWRIELPVAAKEDTDQALLLREVFDRILQFEKTECPFQRSFTVQLPERPATPVKKKPWTATGKNLVSSPFSPEFPASARLAPRASSSQLRDGSEERPKASNARNSGTANPANGSPYSSDVETQSRLKAQTSSSELGKIAPQQSAEESQQITLEQDHHRESSASRLHIIPQETIVAESDQSEPGGSSPSSTSRKAVDVPTEVVRINSATTKNLDLHSPVDKISSPVDVKSLAQSPGTGERRPSMPDIGSPSRFMFNRTPGSMPKKAPSISSLRSLELSKPAAPVIETKTEETYTEPDPIPARRTKAPEETFGDGTSLEGSGFRAPVNLKKKRMSRMLAGRSVTAPQLTVVTSPPPKRREEPLPKVAAPPTPAPPPPAPRVSLPPPIPHNVLEETSPVESTDSFHSVQSWHSPITPLPPSPPSSRPVTPSLVSFPHPHENIIIPKRVTYPRDSSELAQTPATDTTFKVSSAGATIRSLDGLSPLVRSPVEDTPVRAAPVSSSEEEPAESKGRSSALHERPGLRQRPRTHNLSISRRALSPLPPAANLFSPTQRSVPQSPMEVVRRLPGAIIHKTVEILLSPPSHLVNLMLKVAARIAAGEWRGLVFGFSEGGEKIPVQWDYSDGDFDGLSDDDDYMPGNWRRTSSSDSLYRVPSVRIETKDATEAELEDRGWEVD